MLENLSVDYQCMIVILTTIVQLKKIMFKLKDYEQIVYNSK